ncbi:MAG TPA: hypothetical protein VMQ51_02520, partial [Candidatus Binatia bacterium]|nr:hypothetical protein [Candidatus Binatia bacterium]
MPRRGALAATAVVVLAVVVRLVSAATGDAPVFEVDPFWPKPLPDGWLMGQAAGVATKGDHI